MKFDFDMSSSELCHRLREDAGVLFVPGAAFKFDDHFRFGFGNSSDVISSGLDAFSEWIRKNV
jgi:aspartate/methionine/tyrosine aminotransferase